MSARSLSGTDIPVCASCRQILYLLELDSTTPWPSVKPPDPATPAFSAVQNGTKGDDFFHRP